LQLFEEKVTSLRQELSRFSRLGRICDESSAKYRPDLQQLVRWEHFLDNLIYNVPHLKLHLQPLVQFISLQFEPCDFFYDVCFSVEFCKSRQASLFYFGVSFFQLVISVLLLLCHSMTREAEKIVSLCYVVKWKFEHVSKIEEEKFYQFGNSVSQSVPTFRAANFFHISRRTILDMLWIICNFLILLVQFHDKDDHSEVNVH
jgi:hypothetical protein